MDVTYCRSSKETFLVSRGISMHCDFDYISNPSRCLAKKKIFFFYHSIPHIWHPTLRNPDLLNCMRSDFSAFPGWGATCCEKLHEPTQAQQVNAADSCLKQSVKHLSVSWDPAAQTHNWASQVLTCPLSALNYYLIWQGGRKKNTLWNQAKCLLAIQGEKKTWILHWVFQ